MYIYIFIYVDVCVYIFIHVPYEYILTRPAHYSLAMLLRWKSARSGEKDLQELFGLLNVVSDNFIAVFGDQQNKFPL